MTSQITEYLKELVREKGSDLFLKVGLPPAIRAVGQIRILNRPPLSEEEMQAVFETVANKRARRFYEERHEADCAFEVHGIGRFRINIFSQRGFMGMVMRHISARIPSLDILNLPSEPIRRLATIHRGLCLITGIAGSGKSTTLAAMLDHVNHTLPKHIITIEDPIEFTFEDDKCVIDQREIGPDTDNYLLALKASVRQSPDIILIGEIRDRETAEAALAAAETGHMVFGTLHTINATQSVERLINLFPLHLHEFLRQQLAMLLRGVVSLRLLPTKDGKARIPAAEILLDTPRVKELLHEGKIRDIPKALREGAYFGTQTFNQSLKTFIERDLISIEEGLAASDSPEDLRLELRGIMKSTDAGDFNFKGFSKGAAPPALAPKGAAGSTSAPKARPTTLG